MLDDARSSEYDSFVEGYDMLHANDEECRWIRRYRYKGVWPRNLAVLSTCRQTDEADCSILISTISLPDHMVPIAKDRVCACVLSSCTQSPTQGG